MRRSPLSSWPGLMMRVLWPFYSLGNHSAAQREPAIRTSNAIVYVVVFAKVVVVGQA